jgi:hypothetical protein
MTTLNLVDLPVSLALDHTAMTELKGSGCDDWVLRSLTVVTGPWSAYQQMFSNYVGIKFHDGYLSKHIYEGWKRTRTQTEYSYWDHYVCI